MKHFSIETKCRLQNSWFLHETHSYFGMLYPYNSNSAWKFPFRAIWYLKYMNRNACVGICNTSIRATSWENLFMPYANNKGADQPAHPRSLISAFVISSCYVLNFTTLASFCGRTDRFVSYLVANPEDSFSRDVAHNQVGIVDIKTL